MAELSWLELAGVCGIGTVILILIILTIEIVKEILSESLEPDEHEYDDCDCNKKE